MPELTKNPQAVNDGRLAIQAPTGLTFYGRLLKLDGTVFNSSAEAYEASNPANWADYVIPLIEVIATTGVYFGQPPDGADAGTRLLPIYQQAGDAPASTDAIYQPTTRSRPLVFALELSQTSALISMSLFEPVGSPWSAQRAASLPDRQNALSLAQDILNKLYAARQKLATQPYASVTIDGEAVQFTSPKMLEDSIDYWTRKVAVLSGRRRRCSSIRLDRW